MDLIGKTTINPFIFYSGKICGYLTWILYLSALTKTFIIDIHDIQIFAYISYLFSSVGTVIIVISLINLGKSTRLGLPTEGTSFKNNGLYKFSRNPMYLGFNLLTLSSILYTGNIIIEIIGIYSIIVYHFIILSEEQFLLERFKVQYVDYKKRVRRYL